MMFRDIGPYQIVRQIGRGMNPVFLATDTRSDARVALKVVPFGPDEDDREIVDAEEQGAELQRRFAERTEYVPRVYEAGRASDYFYIAMEYIEGDDLSTILAKGPIAPERAVGIAIQLCRFLEEVDRVAGAEGESVQTLLHNDLKPRNIRLQAGDRVKVLDFGAAKVLSLSRRATRNVFGSTPYLSPECLETGKRDRYTDAWAVGVLLYEMVAGRPPFRADDTVSLERRIRSRQPPEPPAGVPDALRRVINKLLAPYPEDRYESASAIRADLEKVLAGEEPSASADGWSQGTVDEPATRRTRQPFDTLDDEPPTRVIASPRAVSVAPVSGVELPTVHTPVIVPVDLDAQQPYLAATGVKRSRFARAKRLLTVTAAIVFMVIVANEARVEQRADRVASRVVLQDFSGLSDSWREYEALSRRSMFGLAVRDLGEALCRRAQALADRVIDNYRSPAPTVRETQWKTAADALSRALTIEPGNTHMRASLRYAEGHLHRINGDAEKSRNQPERARREWAEAVTAFREAAALRPDWPDPFLGLARTFILGIEDIDRGADALDEAKRLGYAIGPRETSQLGDGYRTRGETILRAAESLEGLPQQRESLTRAADAFRRALDLYSTVADYTDVATRIRATQRRLADVDQKLARLAPPPGPLDRLFDVLSGGR